MVGTFWAFAPALIAIILALLTKQVYFSLFAGIFLGAMFLATGNPVHAVGIIYESMAGKLGGNTGILVFLVMLGILVIIMTKTGGTKAYGDWTSSKIKTPRGALGATAGLGVLIFVDDYFNCLTVGNVMRPLTDKHKISRAKLAYIIDSTAAPICIIAPISSWAAAVSGEIDGNGLMVFIKTIPFNLYAILTLIMVLVIIAFNIDFGKMKRNEKIAKETGDLFAGEKELSSEKMPEYKSEKKAKVAYLILPIICLIISCVACMSYTGFYYNWDTGLLGTTLQSSSLIESFANCDAGLSLAIGSTITVFLTMCYYAAVDALDFKESGKSIVEGFQSMIPAILILILAWTLSAIMGAKGGGLDARGFVAANLTADSLGMGVLPAVLFLAAAGISFATGTSWGTFGILIPVATAVIGNDPTPTTFMTVSAILAGSVYGDHISPISDTTILASSGAQCNHVDHVKTQLPYASLVAAVCFISYLCSGFIATVKLSYGTTALITLGIGFILLAISLSTVGFLAKRDKI